MRSVLALFWERNYNVLKDYFGNLHSFCLWVSRREDLTSFIESGSLGVLDLVLERRIVYLGKRGKTIVFDRVV